MKEILIKSIADLIEKDFLITDYNYDNWHMGNMQEVRPNALPFRSERYYQWKTDSNQFTLQIISHFKSKGVRIESQQVNSLFDSLYLYYKP